MGGDEETEQEQQRDGDEQLRREGRAVVMDVLAGDLDAFTEALTADEQRRALEGTDA